MTSELRITYLVLSFILLLIVGSCVTPFTPKINPNDSKPLLVVEGQITDQEGPFRVKLTTAAPVQDLATPEPFLNADVRIIDDQGHTFQLYDLYNGIYETIDKNLKGIPGNTYTLIVITPGDSQQYTSMPVLMQDVPDIDSLYFEQVTHPRITEGAAYQDNWVNILLDAHDKEGITKYWRWDYVETFQSYIQISIFETISCWVTVPSPSIIVASTVNHPIDELNGFIMRSIGPRNPQLRVRYSIIVKQYSLGQDLYNYWKLLRDVNENTGGIYSNIPAPAYGNITCCDGKGKVLGYFAASSVKEKRIFIDRSDNYQMETIQFEGQCPSYVKPPFW